MLVSARDDLGEALLEVFGSELVVGAVGVMECTDVVDAFEDNDVPDASLREDVAVKAGQRIGADAVDQDAIAADAFIEDGKMRGGRVVVKAGSAR